MKDVTRNFVLGLTTLAAALGLGVLLMLFGELDRLIKPRYGLLIRTDDAAGLRAGSTVELNGVPVGVVHDIAMGADPDFPVQLLLLIDDTTRLPADAVPFATTSPLGGAATLQLERPQPRRPVPGWLATDGTAEIGASIRSRLIEQVRDALDNFIAPLVELAGNLNRLLETPDPSDPDAVRASFRTTVLEFNRALAEIKTLVANLNDVFGPPEPADPAASVRTTVASLNTALDQYTRLAQTMRESIDRIAANVVPAMTRLESALHEVQLLAHQAREGPGTVGKLMSSPDLFLSLQDTLETLDALLIEFRLLVQKLETEGVRLGF